MYTNLVLKNSWTFALLIIHVMKLLAVVRLRKKSKNARPIFYLTEIFKISVLTSKQHGLGTWACSVSKNSSKQVLTSYQVLSATSKVRVSYSCYNVIIQVYHIWYNKILRVNIIHHNQSNTAIERKICLLRPLGQHSNTSTMIPLFAIFFLTLHPVHRLRMSTYTTLAFAYSAPIWK